MTDTTTTEPDWDDPEGRITVHYDRLFTELVKGTLADDPMVERTAAALLLPVLQKGAAAAGVDDDVTFDDWRDALAFVQRIRAAADREGVQLESFEGLGQWIATHVSPEEEAEIEHRVVKTARNAPCYCGSGRKYKKCCLP